MSMAAFLKRAGFSREEIEAALVDWKYGSQGGRQQEARYYDRLWDRCTAEGTQTGHAEETILDIGKAVLSFEDLLKTKIPERNRLLPWLPEGGFVWCTHQEGLARPSSG